MVIAGAMGRRSSGTGRTRPAPGRPDHEWRPLFRKQRPCTHMKQPQIIEGITASTQGGRPTSWAEHGQRERRYSTTTDHGGAQERAERRRRLPWPARAPTRSEPGEVRLRRRSNRAHDAGPRRSQRTFNDPEPPHVSTTSWSPPTSKRQRLVEGAADLSSSKRSFDR